MECLGNLLNVSMAIIETCHRNSALLVLGALTSLIADERVKRHYDSRDGRHRCHWYKAVLLIFPILKYTFCIYICIIW